MTTMIAEAPGYVRQSDFFIELAEKFVEVEYGVYQHGDITFKFELDEYGSVKLTSIISRDRRRGKASFVLSQICNMLDKHDLTCYLVPSSFCGWHHDFENRLNDTQLEQWYQRFGFSPYKPHNWTYRRISNKGGA